MKIEKKDVISKVLGLDELPIENSNLIVVEKTSENFEESKKNLQDIISIGNDVLESAAYIAKSSQEPKAFMAVSSLIKSLIDANKNLTEISEKEIQMKSQNGQPQNPRDIIQNNYYGTTSDIIKKIKEKNQ